MVIYVMHILDLLLEINLSQLFVFFFLNDPPPPEFYPFPLPAALPFLDGLEVLVGFEPLTLEAMEHGAVGTVSGLATAFPELIVELVRERSRMAQEEVTRLRRELEPLPDRKSTRLNSSHSQISYAVFCL